MHREISHTDSAFQQERNVSLYLLTALLGLLIGLDLLPKFASWLGIAGLRNWPREYFGYSPALIAAIIGGGPLPYTPVPSPPGGRAWARPAPPPPPPPPPPMHD